MKNNGLWGWRNDSAFVGTWRIYRGPRFDSQHPQSGSWLQVTLVPAEDLTPSPGSHRLLIQVIYINSGKHMHIHLKKKKTFNNEHTQSILSTVIIVILTREDGV